MKRTWFRWVFVRVLIAGALYALLYTGLNVGLSSAIETRTASLKSLGIPMTVDELKQSVSRGGPDAGPFWRAAAELWGGVEASLVHANEESKEPINAFEYQLVDGVMRGPDGKKPASDAEIANLRSFLTQQERILGLLREAADRPGYAPRLDLSEGPGLKLPYLSACRRMAQCVRAAADLAVKDGECDRAIDYWITLRGLARWNESEPLLILQLCSIVIDAYLDASLRESLKIADFSDAQLRRMQALLVAPTNFQERHRRAMTGELVGFGLVMMDELHRGLGGFASVGAPAAGFVKIWLKAEKLAWLSAFRDYFEQTRDIDFGRQATVRIPAFPWYAPLGRMLCPAYAGIAKRFLTEEANRRLMIYVLQLRRHKLAAGTYPQALSDLALDGETRKYPLADPFTGKDFMYRREGDGFVIYSLGENRTDDGGKLEEAEDDIVYALPK
jgi:hypothetical protein